MMGGLSISATARGRTKGATAAPRPLTPEEELLQGIPEFATGREYTAFLKRTTGAKVVFPASMKIEDVREISEEVRHVRLNTNEKGWGKLHIRPYFSSEKEGHPSSLRNGDFDNEHTIRYKPSAVTNYALRDRAVQTGWSSSGNTVSHEIGHALHRQQSPRIYNVWKGRQKERFDRASASRVSQYATTNALEFVAETFAGLLIGREYPTGTLNLYRELGGPKVKGR